MRLHAEAASVLVLRLGRIDGCEIDQSQLLRIFHLSDIKMVEEDSPDFSIDELVRSCSKMGVKFAIVIAGPNYPAQLRAALIAASKQLNVWWVPVMTVHSAIFDFPARTLSLLDTLEGVTVNICGTGSSGLTACALQVAELLALHDPEIRAGLKTFKDGPKPITIVQE